MQLIIRDKYYEMENDTCRYDLSDISTMFVRNILAIRTAIYTIEAVSGTTAVIFSVEYLLFWRRKWIKQTASSRYLSALIATHLLSICFAVLNQAAMDFSQSSHWNCTVYLQYIIGGCLLFGMYRRYAIIGLLRNRLKFIKEGIVYDEASEITTSSSYLATTAVLTLMHVAAYLCATLMGQLTLRLVAYLLACVLNAVMLVYGILFNAEVYRISSSAILHQQRFEFQRKRHKIIAVYRVFHPGNSAAVLNTCRNYWRGSRQEDPDSHE